MNKEEFQTKKNDIDSKIRELKNQKIQLEKEYIESNQGFPVGSKVCITVMAHERYTFWNNERILVPEAKKLAYIADYDIDLCALNHPLRFKVNHGYSDLYDGGFYRNGCKDYKKIDNE